MKYLNRGIKKDRHVGIQRFLNTGILSEINTKINYSSKRRLILNSLPQQVCSALREILLQYYGRLTLSLLTQSFCYLILSIHFYIYYHLVPYSSHSLHFKLRSCFQQLLPSSSFSWRHCKQKNFHVRTSLC